MSIQTGPAFNSTNLSSKLNHNFRCWIYLSRSEELERHWTKLILVARAPKRTPEEEVAVTRNTH